MVLITSKTRWHYDIWQYMVIWEYGNIMAIKYMGITWLHGTSYGDGLTMTVIVHYSTVNIVYFDASIPSFIPM